MPARILDGKASAEKIARSLKKEIASLKYGRKRIPKLISVEIGEDAASSAYVRSQMRLAESIGLDYGLVKIDKRAAESEAISTIKRLSSDDSITAIIIQKPLPEGFNPDRLYAALSPIKDAEGLSPENMGRIFFGKGRAIMPPTVSAVIELIRSSRINLYGKEVVIVGHSEIVGKPLAIALLNEFATVTVCHIATSQRGNLKGHVKKAEVLVVAAGQPNLIKGRWIRKGAVVIDVGINNLRGKVVGDVEFDSARRRASYISPVPGGVGPLTTAMLMRNCVELFKMQRRGV